MTGRIPLIVANWKTNKKVAEVYDFLQEIQGKLPDPKRVRVGIAAQDIYLHEMVKQSQELDIPVAVISENLHWADEGSYTGETSPAALADIGVSGSIVGHYERRKMFKETNGSVGLKVTAALRNELIPIVAIAEDTTRYNTDDEDMAPLTEIAVGLAGVDKQRAENIVVAYEPAWAIGASETPSLEVIEHSAKVIRQSLAILFTQEVADKIRIQYGGSVTPENSKEILGLADIDGLLIGRASLEPAAFLQMVNDAIEG